MCSSVDDVQVAVHVTKILPRQRALDGLYFEASIAACSAQMGFDLRDDHAGATTHRTRAPLPLRRSRTRRPPAGDSSRRWRAGCRRPSIRGSLEDCRTRLGARVVDVDRRHEQFARLVHAVDRVTPVCVSSLTPFTRSTVRCHLSPSSGQHAPQRIEDHLLLVRFGSRVERRASSSALYPLWISSVASPPSSTIKLRARPPGPRAPSPCTHIRAASRLPCEDRHRGGDGAARGPASRRCCTNTAHLGAQLTSVSISTAVWMSCATTISARLAAAFRGLLAAHGHQAGHLVLGDFDSCVPVGQRHVGTL